MTTKSSSARTIIDFQIYAVGGTAIDILRDLQAGNSSQPIEGMDHTTISYVDTSDSNTGSIDQNLIYRFPGLQGGGKNRQFIAQKTAPHISDVLTRFKPKKFNLVVFGAGGASGAAVGPMIVSELMKRGQNVMVATVGSPMGSSTELSNTINTIQSLGNFTKIYKTPLAVFYRQNDEENTVGAVDRAIRSMVYISSALFSNLNHGIEETDLKNFLNFNKVTTFDPALVNFDYFQQVISIPNHVQAIAQATLESDDTDLDSKVDAGFADVAYRCSGRLNPSLNEHVEKITPIHFLLMRGDMAVRLSTLRQRLQAIEQAQAQRAELVEDVGLEIGEDADGMTF